jgi:hypothetical protein
VATLLFSNNAGSTLAGPISNVSLTLQVQAGAGALFANPGANQYFLASLTDAATGLLNEIVQVTSRASDVFTIVRAQEGTTALSWLANDIVANRWTAGSANTMVQLSQLQQQATNYAADTGSVNSVIVALSPAPGSLAGLAGVPIRTQKASASPNTGATTVTASPLASGPLIRPGGAALIAGEVTGGMLLDFRYDGTSYEMLSPSALTPRMQNGTGNPNGSVAGVAGIDLYVDTASLQLWTCTTTGTTSTAVWATPPSPATAASTGLFTLASPQTLSNGVTTQIDLSGSALAFATVAAGGTVTITESGIYSLALNDTGQLTIGSGTTKSYVFISQIIIGGDIATEPWFEGYDTAPGLVGAGNSAATTSYIASGTTITATAFLGDSSESTFSALSVQTATLTLTKIA